MLRRSHLALVLGNMMFTLTRTNGRPIVWRTITGVLAGMFTSVVCLPATIVAQATLSRTTPVMCASALNAIRPLADRAFHEAQNAGDLTKMRLVRSALRDSATKCLKYVDMRAIPAEERGALADVQWEAGDLTGGESSLRQFVHHVWGRTGMATKRTRAVRRDTLSATMRATVHAALTTLVRVTGPLELADPRDSATFPRFQRIVILVDSTDDPALRALAREAAAGAAHEIPAFRDRAYALLRESIVLEGEVPDERAKTIRSAAIAAMLSRIETWGYADDKQAEAQSVRSVADSVFGRYFPYQTAMSDSGLLGAHAPPIEATRWLNASDRQGAQQFGDGKVYVLAFGAHWCAPCRATYAPLATLAQTYAASGLRVLVVTQLYGSFAGNDLAPRAELDSLASYVKQHAISFPVAVAGDLRGAPGESPSSLNTLNYLGLNVQLPTTVLIDRAGIIRGVWQGWSDETEQAVARGVKAFLQEKQTP